MNWQQEWKPLATILAVFAACYWLPVDWLQASQRVRATLSGLIYGARGH